MVAMRPRTFAIALPMQSESLTTSNCPAWPVGAVKSEREQTTRRDPFRDGSRRFDARRINFCSGNRGTPGRCAPMDRGEEHHSLKYSMLPARNMSI